MLNALPARDEFAAHPCPGGGEKIAIDVPTGPPLALSSSSPSSPLVPVETFEMKLIDEIRLRVSEAD
jgi:hypothetical protein